MKGMILLEDLARDVESLGEGLAWAQEFARDRLAPWQIAAGLALLVVVCAVCAAMIYGLLREWVPRRAAGPPANRTIECVVAVALLVYGMGVAVVVLAALRIEDFLPRMLCQVGMNTAAIACLGIAAARRQGRSFHAWDLRRSGAVRLAWTVPAVLLAYLPIHLAVVLVWQVMMARLDWSRDLQPVLLEPFAAGGYTLPVFFAFAVLVVPLQEEIIFRGALYRGLRERFGGWGAALAGSALFAAMHFHTAALVPLFVLSLLLTAVYEWSGSLWSCVLLHALFNGLNLTLA